MLPFFEPSEVVFARTIAFSAPIEHIIACAHFEPMEFGRKKSPKVRMPLEWRPNVCTTKKGTLAFRCEEEILSSVHPGQLELFYNRRIRPLKARMDERYMPRATIWSDLGIIGATFLACATPPRIPVSFRNAGSPTPAFQTLADAGGLTEF